MGIPQLFEVIQDYEESILVAQLAEEHYRRHNRPLRIAVDEADWRFNNVTQAQVYAIREGKDYPNAINCVWRYRAQPPTRHTKGKRKSCSTESAVSSLWAYS